MTLDDMKSLLAGRLGQRTDIDNMIYSEIRQAQRVLEKTPPYPWFLQSQSNTEALPGNSGSRRRTTSLRWPMTSFIS
jgi:hypothetical protein